MIEYWFEHAFAKRTSGVPLAEYQLYAPEYVELGECCSGSLEVMRAEPNPLRMTKVHVVGLVRVFQSGEYGANPFASESRRRQQEFGYSGHRDPADQLASIVSLLFGVPVVAGTRTRQSYIDGVVRPLSETKDPSFFPYLPLPDFGSQGETNLLTILHDRDAEKHVTLLRAATRFKQALWLSVEAPDLSWLMLISAAEIAASFAMKDRRSKALFSAHYPSFQGRVSDDVLTELAQTFGGIAKSTDRFLRFLDLYDPGPPIKRPKPTIDDATVDWSKLPELLRKVYDLRSRYYHQGIPFPPPLMEPDSIFLQMYPESDGTLPERPMVLEHNETSGSWTSSDFPMNLHIFAFIVRGALLKWFLTGPK